MCGEIFLYWIDDSCKQIMELFSKFTRLLLMQVQLYDLCTGGHMTTLRGHAQPVTSLNIHSSPPHTLVSGAADRRSVGSPSELP